MANVDIEQAVPEAKAQKSWFGRNWWWVLLLILVGGGLLCCGICGGFSILMIRNSDPYTMTLDAVRSDPDVIKNLGEPIEDAGKLWDINVQINIKNGEGNATVMLPIAGPKGTANVTSKLRMTDKKWSLTFVEVEYTSGEKKDEKHLLELSTDQAGGGLEEAPPFIPPGEVSPNSMPIVD